MAGSNVVGTTVVTIVDLHTVVNDWAEQLSAQRNWADASLDNLQGKLNEEIQTRTDEGSSLETRVKELEDGMKLMKMATVPNAMFKTRLDQCFAAIDQTNEGLKNLNQEVANATEEGKVRTETGLAELAEQLRQLGEAEEALEAKVADLKGSGLAALRKDLQLEQEAREADVLRLQEGLSDLDSKLRQGLATIRAELEEAREVDRQSASSALNQRIAELIEGELRNTQVLAEEAVRKADDARKDMLMHLAETSRRIQAEIANLREAKASNDDLRLLKEDNAVKLAGVQQTAREEACGIRGDLAEARAAAVTHAVQNETATKAVAHNLATIQALMNELKVKDAATLVWEWEGAFVPKTEEELRRLRDGLRAAGHVLDEVQRETKAIRSHFKMFHAIAAGLDNVQDSEQLGPQSEDMLPPLPQR